MSPIGLLLYRKMNKFILQTRKSRQVNPPYADRGKNLGDMISVFQEFVVEFLPQDMPTRYPDPGILENK